ncbi:hypothetical protein E2C01_091184 [Portunus trituberculatus]|uniref:Uncharacterized protein n=1 Tax=Portunus trituberculatus TaxID=210409 RepID=A0A5B7JUC9_PORTR|nr:hypothetical protein [Portunus trituberculatus]
MFFTPLPVLAPVAVLVLSIQSPGRSDAGGGTGQGGGEEQAAAGQTPPPPPPLVQLNEANYGNAAIKRFSLSALISVVDKTLLGLSCYCSSAPADYPPSSSSSCSSLMFCSASCSCWGMFSMALSGQCLPLPPLALSRPLRLLSGRGDPLRPPTLTPCSASTYTR